MPPPGGPPAGSAQPRYTRRPQVLSRLMSHSCSAWNCWGLSPACSAAACAARPGRDARPASAAAGSGLLTSSCTAACAAASSGCEPSLQAQDGGQGRAG